MLSLMAPNFLFFTILIIGLLNLIVPYTSKKDSLIRNSLLITISFFFLINILILDFLFLEGVRINLTLFSFSKYNFELHLEPLGLIFLTLLSILWICSIMYTTKFLVINNIKKSSRFLFFLNLCVLCGVIISLSANLFTMFVSYEILTLATIPLIAHSGGEKVITGLEKYLTILMGSSLVLFLPAIIIIYTKVGHGNFIYDGFIESFFSRKIAIILLLMFIFGISKAALYPLYDWLPAAMVAEYPVSALLHAVVVVKAGLFCIYKILIYVFGFNYLITLFGDFNWILLFPAFTILYTSIKAIETNNIKMMLAYSTINQLNIALLSAFMFTPKAMGAAIFHMVSHSFSKICLFYAAGNFASLKNTIKVKDLYGIAKEMPKTSFVLLLACLSLIGVPPFGGFISKFYIMLAAVDQKNILIMIILAFSTLLSAFYVGKIIIFIYRPNFYSSIKKNAKISNLILAKNQIIRMEAKLPFSMLLSLCLCLVGVIGFFFIQKFINQFLSFL